MILYWPLAHWFYLFSDLFFSVRHLSVPRGHSVFSSSPQRPMTSDFEGFSNPDFIHYILFCPYLNSSERASNSLFKLSAKQGHYWYHLWYDAALDWGLNPRPSALDASTLPLDYRGGGILWYDCIILLTKYSIIIWIQCMLGDQWWIE